MEGMVVSEMVWKWASEDINHTKGLPSTARLLRTASISFNGPVTSGHLLTMHYSSHNHSVQKAWPASRI